MAESLQLFKTYAANAATYGQLSGTQIEELDRAFKKRRRAGEKVTAAGVIQSLVAKDVAPGAQSAAAPAAAAAPPPPTFGNDVPKAAVQRQSLREAAAHAAATMQPTAPALPPAPAASAATSESTPMEAEVSVSDSMCTEPSALAGQQGPGRSCEHAQTSTSVRYNEPAREAETASAGAKQAGAATVSTSGPHTAETAHTAVTAHSVGSGRVDKSIVQPTQPFKTPTELVAPRDSAGAQAAPTAQAVRNAPPPPPPPLPPARSAAAPVASSNATEQAASDAKTGGAVGSKPAAKAAGGLPGLADVVAGKQALRPVDANAAPAVKARSNAAPAQKLASGLANSALQARLNMLRGAVQMSDEAATQNVDDSTTSGHL